MNEKTENQRKFSEKFKAQFGIELDWDKYYITRGEVGIKAVELSERVYIFLMKVLINPKMVKVGYIHIALMVQ